MTQLTAVLPWFLPGLVVSVLVAGLIARPLARGLGASVWVAFLLVVGVGAALAATLPPDGNGVDALPGAVARCDLSRIGFAPLASYLEPDDVSANVALFLPLGLAAGALPRSRWSVPILIGVLVLPLAIELTQLLVPALGRGCQSGDVVDNLLGLVLGIAAGRFLRWASDRGDRAAR